MVGKRFGLMRLALFFVVSDECELDPNGILVGCDFIIPAVDLINDIRNRIFVIGKVYRSTFRYKKIRIF